MERSIEISWEEFKRCAVEKIEEKYPDMKGAVLMFKQQYSYEGPSYYEDPAGGKPDGVTFTIKDEK